MPPTATRRPDLLGALVLPAGFVSLLLAVGGVGAPGWAVVAAVVGVALLCVCGSRAADRWLRVLDLRLLRITGFGAIAAPSFSSVYRTVPADRIPYATPSLFVTVQLSAAVGAAVAATLMTHLDAPVAVRAGYCVVVVVLLVATYMARHLPGRV
ncbi:hypothetical protein ACLQ3C_10595 [Gordonia sp. DT30]|uniref:hypothetical protein n=1 Tax=unclassified Gordonia (in: high G+C Gram-positive bacteria) TaxID=2657482 RepID=UPI003CF8DB6C